MRPGFTRSRVRAHPRRRGEHKYEKTTARVAAGSSPQARGAQGAWFVGDEPDGLIPAGAGSTRNAVMP